MFLNCAKLYIRAVETFLGPDHKQIGFVIVSYFRYLQLSPPIRTGPGICCQSAGQRDFPAIKTDWYPLGVRSVTN
jgi:hypothetical protein